MNSRVAAISIMGWVFHPLEPGLLGLVLTPETTTGIEKNPSSS